MKARINIITLAVSDLGRALVFYREGLGLDSPGIKGDEYAGDEQQAAGAVAMFGAVERCKSSLEAGEVG